nr:hypothetical protein [Tanacetum cinerariifolium]
MTSSTIATTTTTSQAPILPTTVSSNIIQNLPKFGSLFRFDDRLRSLEENFSEVMQTNQFTGAVSAIAEIVQHYMDQRMNEAVKVAVQIQSDQLRDEAQRENEEFLRTVDENIKKIINEQVKEQVKVQVSKILSRIEQAVNEQLEAEVLTRLSHSSRTSYVVAADLSEMELKKILIEKMEGNKSIQRSDEQRNLYKAFVDAYESDKIILDTYEETVTLRRRRDDDEDKDEEYAAGPDRGSKRCREGKELESASAPSETATRSAGRSTIGSRSQQASASESALVEDPVQTTSPMEEPSHLEFDTGADDQPIVQSSQHLEWFSQQHKPPTPDRAWNKTLSAVYGSIQSHQNTQQFGALLPIELTNDEIRNSKAYNEYYAIAIGEAAPKPKATQTYISQPSGSSADEGTGFKPGVPDVPTDESEEELFGNSTNDKGDDNKEKDNDGDEEDEGDDGEEGNGDDDDDDDGEEGDDDVDQEVIRDDDKDDAEESGDDEEEGKGMESIFETTSRIDVQNPTSVAPLPITTPTMTSSTIATTTTTSQAPILPTTVPSDIIQNLPKFGSLFHFDDRLRLLEENFSEVMQTNQFADKQRNLYKALVDAYESDKIILDTYEETVTLKRRHDDDEDKDEEPSAGSDRGSKRCRECADDQPIVQSSQHPECELAKQADTRSSFNELMDTPMDFSNFFMNRLRVDTLTPELLVGPTYKLMKGSCKSLIELEYHLEEVYKATTDQLDWVNPEGQQYPHNLLQPLPLIPDNRGRRVIPFEHFINNDLEYLCRGTSSRKYTTLVMKTNAADYEHIKWIEDLVPRTMWIHEPIDYDKHALLGVSHWGRKRQQFYGFAVNRKSARDVYSKRRIIAVTELKIVKWHSYKHLDWITVRRDDDKLYKFKEGDFKRLRIQDIEDMLLLLIQGKLTNLTVEERFAFNVSLWMFTRSIVI